MRQEHKYEYSSRTTGLLGEFTLTTAASFTGTATTNTTDTLLEDTGQSFVSDGVKVGMLIRNTADSDSVWEILEVIDDENLAIIEIHGTGGNFTDTDTYEINRLVQNYAVTDDLYDLILDLEAVSAGTTESNNFTKAIGADFDVVVNVRQGKIILPFTLNQSQGDGSTTVTVVRQPDNIAT